VRVDHAGQGGAGEGRGDRIARAGFRGRGSEGPGALVALARPARGAIAHPRAEGLVGLRAHRLQDVGQRLRAVRLHAHVGGEAPHGEVLLERVDVDVHEARAGLGLHELGQPGHVHVQQQAQVGAGQRLRGIEAAEAGRGARHVHRGGHELVHADAAFHGQRLQRGHRFRLAPQVGGDHHRLARLHQGAGDLASARPWDSAGLDGPEARGREAGDAGVLPFLRQRLARQRQVHGAGRVAVHHAVRAPQHLLGHHAAGQRVLPLHVRPHQAADVERVLHEVHVVVARAGQLAAQREGRLARHQQHRPARAEQVVHAHRRIGGAGVHVHQHALAAAGHRRIAGGHVDGDVLVRAQHHVGLRPPFARELRHGLDQRHVVRAEIGEQVLDARFGEAVEEMVGRTAALGRWHGRRSIGGGSWRTGWGKPARPPQR
jgi:hypothetical protein